MKALLNPILCWRASALFLCLAGPCRAFLGFADTSFVTVIANPAEAANWAAELEKLDAQLSAASGTLQKVGDLRAYAGDPAGAVRLVPDLASLSLEAGALSAGGRTASDLREAWQASGHGAQETNSLLEASGAGQTMSVFGQAVPRDAALYLALAREAATAGTLHGQIGAEQRARSAVSAELASAWARFKAATTESHKQAILSEVVELQAQNQVLDARRRALLDDLQIADREDRAASTARSRASDEELLAESALLSRDAASRAQGSESSRLATLAKTSRPKPAPDYSGLRLWTTADTGGAAP